MGIKARILAVAGSIMLVATLGAATVAPVAAHHDDEFTFFDVYVAVERGMDAKTWSNHKAQFNRGRAITHNVRGWREHTAPTLPRWIARQCRSEARDVIYDGFKYGRALARWGRGMNQSPDFAYAPNPLRAKILAKASRNATYRTIEGTVETFEDCVASGFVPRRFR